MKRFPRHISFVLLITVVSMVLLDVAFTSVYETTVPRNKFQYILKMPQQQMDYVFLGSSRTADHIIAADVQQMTGGRAINLGIEGAILGDNLLQLKLLLDQKVTIRKVFLQVDYLYNATGVSDIANQAALPYIHHPVVAAYLSDKIDDYNAKYYVPFYRYMATDYAIGFREFFFSLCHKKGKVDLRDGFTPKTGSIGLKPFEFPAQLAGRNRDIEAFHQLCKQNNIELVLFCAPIASKVVHQDFVNKLKERLPGFHDYTKALPDHLFYDGGHLNADGAKEFTRLIVNDCILK